MSLRYFALSFVFVSITSHAAGGLEQYPELVPPVLSTETKSLLTDLQIEQGRIIPYAELPALYEMMTKVFRRVAQAQEDLVKNDFVAINYLYLLDSPLENAFVYRPPHRGVRVTTNLVFMTTAMLRKLVDLDPKKLAERYPDIPVDKRAEKEIETGMLRIAGMLAHELAHPLDELIVYDRQGQSLSIEKEYGKRGSQALELRTDVQGALLARAGNIPERAVMETHERALSDSVAADSAQAVLSTHPDNSLRMTAMRMFLTINRLREGDNQKATSFRLSDVRWTEFAKELEIVAIARGPLPWNKPRDIEETLGRLRRITKIHFEHQDLEYNRLILALDHQIEAGEAGRGERWTEKLKLEIANTYRFLLRSNSHLALWSQTELNENLKPFGDSAELMLGNSHAHYLNKLKFYREAKYISALPPPRDPHSQQYGTADPDNEKRIRVKYIEGLAAYIPADLFAAKYGEEFVRLDIELMHAKEGHYESLVGGLGGRELTMLMFVEELRQMGKHGNDHALATLMAGGRKNSHMPFFLKSFSESSALTKLSAEFETLVRQTCRLGKTDPTAQYHCRLVKEQARVMWEHRADFAQGELMLIAGGADVAINWDFIGELLELNTSQMGNQIATAFMNSLIPQKIATLGSYLLEGQYHSLEQTRTLVILDAWEEPHENITPTWYRAAIGQRLLELRSGPTYNNRNFMTGLQVLLRSALAVDRESRASAYRSFLKSYFVEQRSLRWTKENVSERLEQMEKFVTQKLWLRASYRDIPNHLSTLTLAEVISESQSLTYRDKQILLTFIFARDESFDLEESERVNAEYYRWTTQLPETVEKIYAILVAHGVVKSPSEFGKKLKASPHFKPIANVRQSFGQDGSNAYEMQVYFEYVDRIAPTALSRDHIAGLNWDQLMEAVKMLQSPLASKVDRAHSNTPNIQEVRDGFALRAGQLASDLDLDSRLHFFLDLTATGSSPGADGYFDRHLRKDLLAHGEYYMTWIKGILMRERIQSGEFRLRLAQAVLEKRIQGLSKNNSVSSEDLFSLVTDLNLMAPQGSLAKDDFLESLAWRLSLTGARLGAFVEDQKTSNWKRENAMLANAGSGVANGIYRLSMAGRREFLNYLIDPAGNRAGLPLIIQDELMEQAMEQIIKEKNLDRRRIRRAALEVQARRISRAMKLQVERYIRDAAPIERIPLIEMLLTAGPESFNKKADFQLTLSRDFLGYGPDSVEEKMLLSYLAVIPDHEVSPSLAYLLSQAKEDKRTVANLFQLFSTVGIKFGQLTSIWQIFGAKVASETRHLKDQAPAMSKFDILERMKKLLPSPMADQIELVEILGSASVKTVVLVRLPDGRQAVMAIQAAAIHDQIATTLNMGERFLDELERRNLIGQSRMLSTLIKALREQLKEEVNFKQEAANYAVAGRMLKDLNANDAQAFNGWSFSVPELIQGMPLLDEIAFYDLAEGKPYDKLTPKQRREVGPMLTRASLAMLFRYGYFDADRHKGNWLIDGKAKKIYAIDFGQLEDFRGVPGTQDPRQVVVGFVQAMQARNVEMIYAQFVAMVKGDSAIPALTSELRQAFTDALSKPDLPDQIIEVLTAATEAGFDVERRYSFGAMKGLLILYGENYVSKEDFGRILTEEVSGWFMRGMSGNKSELRCEEDLRAS